MHPTKTQLLKKKSKLKHNIEKKSVKKLNIRGRRKRPEASTLKEYMEFPWSITFFFIYIICFLIIQGANALRVAFPLHLVLLPLQEEEEKQEEAVWNFLVKELSGTRTLRVQQ